MLEPLCPQLGLAALALFVIGIVVMMAGIVRAIQELWVTLPPLEFEHEMLEMPHGQPNGVGRENGIDPDTGTPG